ncbi:hypothetical protein OEZ86_008822 [Tetradesmus obliquus]|nr:hypothetical protein OEZ86_008822 [Tetradesmus obliquus]
MVLSPLKEEQDVYYRAVVVFVNRQRMMVKLQWPEYVKIVPREFSLPLGDERIWRYTCSQAYWDQLQHNTTRKSQRCTYPGGWRPKPGAKNHPYCSLPTSSASLFRAAAAAAAAAAADPAATCPPGPQPGNPDYGKGQSSQRVSYGIPMMQVDKLAGVANRSNVLFCMVGLAISSTNKDMPEDIKGCVPGTPRKPGGPPRTCYPFDDNIHFQNAMVALSAIGAQDNSIGLLGVVPNAAAYVYNLWPTPLPNVVPLLSSNAAQIIAAWADCEAELNARKANRSSGMPDLKMLVMSDTVIEDASIEAAGAYIKAVSKRRSDIIFTTYASSLATPETLADSFTATAAKPAGFASSAAPGPFVIWTSSVGKSDKEASAYGRPRTSIAVTPPLAGAQAGLWASPPPGSIGRTSSGSISGALVDCPKGFETCANAMGKSCLIQRGETPFADKVVNCVKGGGIAAIIYARDDQPPCKRWFGDVIGNGVPGPLPNDAWPIMLTASLAQGKALLAALKAGKLTSVTLTSLTPPDVEVPIYFGGGNELLAAAMGSGAIGALWSAHTSCSASQVIAAIVAAARVKVDPSLSSAELNQRYGKGLPQVWDAHTYLLANPCKATPIITITSTTGKSRPKDAAAPKDAPADASPNQGCIGFFNITVTVRDKVSRAPAGIVPVTLSLDSSSLVSCSGAATRNTGKRGGALWSCRRCKADAPPGVLTITAAAAESNSYAAASATVTVPV